MLGGRSECEVATEAEAEADTPPPPAVMEATGGRVELAPSPCPFTSLLQLRRLWLSRSKSSSSSVIAVVTVDGRRWVRGIANALVVVFVIVVVCVGCGSLGQGDVSLLFTASSADGAIVTRRCGVAAAAPASLCRRRSCRRSRRRRCWAPLHRTVTCSGRGTPPVAWWAELWGRRMCSGSTQGTNSSLSRSLSCHLLPLLRLLLLLVLLLLLRLVCLRVAAFASASSSFFFSGIFACVLVGLLVGVVALLLLLFKLLFFILMPFSPACVAVRVGAGSCDAFIFASVLARALGDVVARRGVELADLELGLQVPIVRFMLSSSSVAAAADPRPAAALRLPPLLLLHRRSLPATAANGASFEVASTQCCALRRWG